MIDTTISHYKIVSKLGEGGMGEVYLAEDLKLKRQVALKFLPIKLKDHTEKERFLQEAQAAAAINHPNVCVIYEIDDGQDSPFIAMEYIKGKTLRLAVNEQQFTIDECINYATQIAKGLNIAHQKGIVHRDVKSENIMVTEDNQMKVMDFGLAKLKGSVKLTKTSSTIGTLAYMAPEQIEGQPVDSRSDIFSYGVVLYELLSGHMPFKGDYDAAVIYSIMNDEPYPIQNHRPDIPLELVHIINRSLEKNPDDRYQSMDDVLIDLRRLKRDTSKITEPIVVSKPTSESILKRPNIKKYKVILGIAILIIIAIFISLIAIPTSKDEAINSLAILPFVNIGGDEVTEYLSDGIPESIVSSLQKIPDLRVASFSSMLYRYKGKEYDPVVVGEEMDVESVAMGRLTLQGENISISIEIVDTRDNSVILAKQYIEKLANLFDIQTTIAQDITDKLSLELTGREQHTLASLPEIDPEAYQNYLKGRHFWYKRNPEDFKKAIGYFLKAIEIDPNYALAYCGLADTYTLQNQYGGIPNYRIVPPARKAAKKALELDSLSAEAQTSMGGVLTSEGKYSLAKKRLEKAIDLNPDYILAYHWLGINLQSMGEFGEEVGVYEKALQLDPMSPIIASNLASSYAFNGQVKKSMEQFKKNIALFPDHPTTYSLYGIVLSRLNRHDEAIAMLKKAVAKDSLSFSTHAGLAWIYQEASRYQESIDQCRKMMHINPDFIRAAHVLMGRCYRKAGEFDKAVEHYQKAIEFDPLADEAHRFLGRFYRILGEYEKSIDRYKKIVELYPDNPDNFNNYGLALVIVGRYQEAITQLIKATELDPINRDFLGLAYYLAGDFAQATKTLEKAVQLDAKSGYARFFLSLVYFSNQDFEGCAKQFKTYLEILKFPEREEYYAQSFATGEFSKATTQSYLKLVAERILRDNIPGFDSTLRAVIFALCNERDKTMELLHEAHKKQEFELTLWIISSAFNTFHPYQEYRSLIKKLKLDTYHAFN